MRTEPRARTAVIDLEAERLRREGAPPELAPPAGLAPPPARRFAARVLIALARVLVARAAALVRRS